MKFSRNGFMPKSSCAALIAVLGVSAVIATSPLSKSGCACKSGCDKSWMHSGAAWCYVDASCNSAGWETCPDAQMLYMSAVTEKAKAEREREEEAIKRQDAEKHEEELNVQLAGTKSELHDSEAKVASLNKKLSKLEGPSASELAAQKKLGEMERKVKDIQQAADMKVTEAKQNLKKAEDAQNNAEVKMHSQVDDIQREADAKIKEVTQKETQAEEVQHESEALMLKLDDEIKHAETKQVGTEAMLNKAQRQLKDSEKTRQEDELKLSGDELKQASAEKKLQMDKVVLKEQQEANGIMVDAATAKFKEAEKSLLDLRLSSKAQLADAGHKQAETEKKIEQVEQQLKESVTQHATTKNKLEKAVQQKEEAEVDSKIYKVFKDAQLRGLQKFKQQVNTKIVKVFKDAQLRGLEKAQQQKHK